MVTILKPSALNDAAREKTYNERLFRSVQESYRLLKPFRTYNQNVIREFGGPTYGDTGSKKIKFMNKLRQAIEGWVMMLAANRPECKIETEHLELLPFAEHWTVNSNNMLKEIQFENFSREWLLNAIFCVGIAKVHLADSGYVHMEMDIHADPGTPFASCVSIDDWVHDMGVKRESQCKFKGDMYRVPWSFVEEGVEIGMFDEEEASEMSPTSKTGDKDGERVDQIAAGYDTDEDEIEPMVDLADIWDPREKLIRTYAVDMRREFKLKSMTGRALGQMEWDGVETGPYEMLGFTNMPEHVMPVAPSMHIEPLDRHVNNLMRKTSRQALRYKKNLIYTAAGKSDAERLTRADDGESIAVQSISEIGTHEQGGVDPGTVNTLAGALDLFDEQAGGLRTILGLGQQADTLGQEQLIQNAGSRMMGHMQGRFIDGLRRVIRNMNALLWKDEFMEIVSSIPIEGSPGLAVHSNWKPGDREGKFQDYNFSINIFSTMFRPPTQKAQSVIELLSTVYAPFMEMLMSQGAMIDMSYLNHFFAESMGLPELRQLVTFRSGTPNNMPGPQASAGKPQVSNRNYTRRNVSAPSSNSYAHKFGDMSQMPGTGTPAKPGGMQ